MEQEAWQSINMEEIIIREGRGKDWFDIKAIQKVVWLDTYPNKEAGITREAIERGFVERAVKASTTIEEKAKTFGPTEDSVFWVAEIGSKIVGYVGVHKEDGKKRLGAIYILPEFQGRGVGNKLFKKALEWIDADAEIEVAAYNEKAINFYKKFGYRVVAKKKDFKFTNEVIIPSVLMKK